jgi:surfactin synthase thioesterase subunit
MSRSRRSGALSDDPELVERRKWYIDTYNKTIEDRDAKKADEERAIFDAAQIAMGKAKAALSEEEQKRAEAKELAAKPVKKEVKKTSAFVSLSLEVAEESFAKSEVINKEVLEPLPIYSKPNLLDASKWLCRYTTSPSKFNSPLKLLCFHGVGGNPNTFRDWVEYFKDEDVEIISVQLPGRTSFINEKMPKSFTIIVGSIVDALIDLNIIPIVELDIEDQDLGPNFCFFGHHMGAIIAFEVARLLKYKGYKNNVTQLIVSSSQAPNILSVANKDKFGRKYHVASSTELLVRMENIGAIPKLFRSRRDLVSTTFQAHTRDDYRINEKYRFVVEMTEIEFEKLREKEIRKGRSGNIVVEEVPQLNCPIIVIGTDDDDNYEINDMKDWLNHTTSDIKYLNTFQEGGYFYLSIQSKLDMVINMIKSLIIKEEYNEILFDQILFEKGDMRKVVVEDTRPKVKIR